MEFLVYIRMNDHAIQLEKSKQLSFEPIYSLEIIKLEILKTYIKNKLAISLIWHFKSFVKSIHSLGLETRW